MPLFHRKTRYYPGDLIVFFDVEIEEQNLGDVDLTLYESYHGFIEPLVWVLLAEYRGSHTASPDFASIYPDRDVCNTFYKVKILADIEVFAQSYTCKGFRHYNTCFGDGWKFTDLIPATDIMGQVSGKVDLNDPYACRAYLRQVVKKYRPQIQEILADTYHDFTVTYDIYPEDK